MTWCNVSRKTQLECQTPPHHPSHRYNNNTEEDTEKLESTLLLEVEIGAAALEVTLVMIENV